jgi:hypothetical protein
MAFRDDRLDRANYDEKHDTIRYDTSHPAARASLRETTRCTRAAGPSACQQRRTLPVSGSLRRCRRRPLRHSRLRRRQAEPRRRAPAASRLRGSETWSRHCTTVQTVQEAPYPPRPHPTLQVDRPRHPRGCAAARPTLPQPTTQAPPLQGWRAIHLAASAAAAQAHPAKRGPRAQEGRRLAASRSWPTPPAPPSAAAAPPDAAERLGPATPGAPLAKEDIRAPTRCLACVKRIGATAVERSVADHASDPKRACTTGT